MYNLVSSWRSPQKRKKNKNKTLTTALPRNMDVFWHKSRQLTGAIHFPPPLPSPPPPAARLCPRNSSPRDPSIGGVLLCKEKKWKKKYEKEKKKYKKNRGLTAGAGRLQWLLFTGTGSSPWVAPPNFVGMGPSEGGS